MPPSPGRGLPLCMHCPVYLPEAPLHLLAILGPGDGSSVLGGTSSIETSRLQYEEPGAQGSLVEIDV